MNIALVNRWYPPYTSFGGVAAYDYYLAHALVNAGHAVTVLAARWSRQAPGEQEDSGVHVLRLLFEDIYWARRLPLLGYYIRPLRQWIYSRQVCMALNLLDKDRPIDVIEFADVNAEGWAYLRSPLRRPVVVRCHTPTFVLRNYSNKSEMPYDTAIVSKMERECIRKADLLTAPSNHMAATIAQICNLSTDCFRVIPNPLDVSLFAKDGSRVAGQENGEVLILHVGRLERVKGILVLADAIPLVIRQYPRARFVFIGEGKAGEAAVKDKLTKLKVDSSRVTFLGGVNQPELVKWYHQADIVVVPTLNYESFSYTCAQAMAAGRPLVASRIGGIPETVGEDQRAGILVEPGNVQELVDALLTLCRDPLYREKMGSIAVFEAKKRFSSDCVAKMTLEAYRTVIR